MSVWGSQLELVKGEVVLSLLLLATCKEEEETQVFVPSLAFCRGALPISSSFSRLLKTSATQRAHPTLINQNKKGHDKNAMPPNREIQLPFQVYVGGRGDFSIYFLILQGLELLL